MKSAPTLVELKANPQRALQATATPALFAQTASEGRWRLARHLAYLDRALTDAVEQGGRLIVSMPPRHGKSELCSKYLPAWFVGTRPHKNVILSSYEAEFAAEWGYKVRSLVNEWGWLFGVKVADDSRAANRWKIAGKDGGMRTAGVGGPITGKGADLLVIDDPVKNAEQASSPTYRRKMWEWWESTASTRLEPGSCAVVIQTRWHEDDLAGRLIANEGNRWRVINFPAIAEETDVIGRKVGESLWPWRWPLDALLKIKADRSAYWWAAMFQQRPVAKEGGMFRREWLQKILPETPAEFDSLVRYWDKAGSPGSGDWTCGVLMGKRGGEYVVLDVVKGQWLSGERNRIILNTAKDDDAKYPGKVRIWLEQEGGSGGKESAEISVRELAGYRAKVEHPTGSKEARADAFASQCEVGNVSLVFNAKSNWTRDYIDELCSFPQGTHDDQVDASSGAFNKLAMKKSTWAVG